MISDMVSYLNLNGCLAYLNTSCGKNGKVTLILLSAGWVSFNFIHNLAIMDYLTINLF